MENEPLNTLVRDVSATFNEYEQGLRQAVPGGLSGGPQRFMLQDGKVRIQIDLEPIPDLVIALMRLPRLRATWQFLEGSEAEKRACLKRIDWSMKRGGG